MTENKKHLLDIDVNSMSPELKMVWGRAIAHEAKKLPKRDFESELCILAVDFNTASEHKHSELARAVRIEMDQLVLKNLRKPKKAEIDKLNKIEAKIKNVDSPYYDDEIEYIKEERDYLIREIQIKGWPQDARDIYQCLCNLPAEPLKLES